MKNLYPKGKGRIHPSPSSSSSSSSSAGAAADAMAVLRLLPAAIVALTAALGTTTRSFWSRWDCSPDRELIHQAIDAYEDHVAAAQSELHAGGGGGGSRATRRRERRSSEKREKAKAKRVITSGETRSVCDDGEAVIKEAEGGRRRWRWRWRWPWALRRGRSF
uniref:Uncharacterized protein n=1 Tax=Ananas comosus var. bracteatus TaxID=296719 RepID=A0A6V7P0Q7_ANACO|nr:unnamed protein product [Ananas comosus var. bracteatus]